MEKKKGGAGSKVVGKSIRVVMPNLQRIKILHNGTVQRALVCTSCIQANKVTRAA
ncbi:MAG: 50S ribosomal protein L28 [Candidatus Omnitrophota bacterium]